MKRVYAGVAVALATLLTAQRLSAQDEKYVSPWKTPWTYRDQDRWGDLDPDYGLCKTGREQSPIDIRRATPAKLPPLQFVWTTAPMRPVINNRYTVRINYRPGNGNWLIVGDKRYELVQFHFHHPAEDKMDGRSYPMETHLMYKGADGSVVGVTVFNPAGRANAPVQTVFDHAPMTEGLEPVHGVEFTAESLVPSDRVRRYDTYMGSVSAPPCTEGVRWYLLTDTVSLSPRQIAWFAKLWPNDDRKVQPLNGRVVERSR